MGWRTFFLDTPMQPFRYPCHFYWFCWTWASDSVQNGIPSYLDDLVDLKFSSNNMLYPKEDRSSKTLLFACRNCDHQEEATEHRVYRNNVMPLAMYNVSSSLDNDFNILVKPYRMLSGLHQTPHSHERIDGHVQNAASMRLSFFSLTIVEEIRQWLYILYAVIYLAIIYGQISNKID